MKRDLSLEQLSITQEWDIIIIGGGATGLGSALDAASRGYKTLLVEQYDFAKGTSSRSTKLVHGGVRYLAQGNIKLVREALRERAFLLKNAAHLTSVQAFIVPVFSLWEKFYYAIGLKMYDLLSGKLTLGKTSLLSKNETSSKLPAINTKKLFGGILYYDGQFDDSRLCIDLAVTATRNGASLINYMKAVGFQKSKGKITGISLYDAIHDKTYQVRAKSFINATGVFTDSVLQMDDEEKEDIVSPSQGIHLVVDAHFFPGDHAMMIPKTDDGRVLFAVPWLGKVVIGTTDTPIDFAAIEPRPLEEEIEFLLSHINRYTTSAIKRSDVKTVFAGLRPLVKMKEGKSTALLSRDHTLVVSTSGLVTITGGKWTTYRKMAEDAVSNALFIAKLEKKECVTRDLPIGEIKLRESKLQEMMLRQAFLKEKIHPDYPYLYADVLFAIEYEMAQTLEDILARRTRLLFLDCAAAKEVAATVLAFMAKEMQKDPQWEKQELENFQILAEQYLLT